MKPIKQLFYLTKRLFPFLGVVDEVIYFIQRGVRGWSDRDCWSIDYHLDEKIPEMLLRLKETKHGVPQEFVDQVVQDGRYEYTNDEIDRAVVLYNAMLDRIIDGFRAHRELQDNDWDWVDLATHRQKQAACRQRFEDGMTLFVKYYDTFWD